MTRRHFVKAVSASAVAASAPSIFIPRVSAAELDAAAFRNLADVALATAKELGASYAEHISTREQRVEAIHSSQDAGFGVRVLARGAWGFSASNTVSEEQIEETTRHAVELARASQRILARKIDLERVPAYEDEWTMPMRIDPFTVSLDDKIKKLLAVNNAAQRAGADFCRSSLSFVREEKFFACSRGSYIRQRRVRSFPQFTATVVDKKTGRFENRRSFAAPRGSGYEYVQQYDLAGEAERAAAEAKMKLVAKSVAPGKKDLVIDPTNLWLTIHETVGHPTELDRALGYEANFAGTSFVTLDKLRKLRYGSDLVTITGDRTAPGGLATVAYDDDGVQTKGAEFAIIKNGRFENYQLSAGFARAVDRRASNGCAYADSWETFPIQRMPNISLQPGEKKISPDELIADVKDGIYILGDGSWSIDHQRYNFQFGGQPFYEIKNGKLGRMLRDVAYQGNTVDFWNACDALCGKEEYFLGGAFNCGKGQPQQLAPVSHGAVPARFRGINVINTERTDI
jgi:TldD protein